MLEYEVADGCWVTGWLLDTVLCPPVDDVYVVKRKLSRRHHCIRWLIAPFRLYPNPSSLHLCYLTPYLGCIAVCFIWPTHPGDFHLWQRSRADSESYSGQVLEM